MLSISSLLCQDYLCMKRNGVQSILVHSIRSFIQKHLSNAYSVQKHYVKYYEKPEKDNKSYCLSRGYYVPGL